MALLELDRFRQKNPQYNDLDDETLAGRLAAKYPEYSDLPGKVRPSAGTPTLSKLEQVESDIQARPSTGFARAGERIQERITQPQDKFVESMMKALNPIETLKGRNVIQLGDAFEDFGSLLTLPRDVVSSSLFSAGLQNKTGQQTRRDIGQTILGRRNVMPSDIMRGGNLPGGESGLARGLADFYTTPGSISATKSVYQLGKLGLKGIGKGFKEAGEFAERIGLKTPSSIPTNPSIDDLARMKSTDRQIYINSQREIINTKSGKQLNYYQERLRGEGEQLASRLEHAGKEAVLKARPALSDVMSKASPEWRKLVKETLDEGEDIQVPFSEITEELSRKFGGDQSLVKKALDQIDVSLAGQLERNMISGTQVNPLSAKEIFGKLVHQKQLIPFQQRSGNVLRYQEKDFFTDSLIESLTNILRNHGLDFSNANRFWSPYAQLRNSLFKSIKPFMSEPFETESGARLLRGAASGKGKISEVSELEKRSGQDLLTNLKDIIEKQKGVKSSLESISEASKLEKARELGSLTTRNLLAKGKASDIQSKKRTALLTAAALASYFGFNKLRSVPGLNK